MRIYVQLYVLFLILFLVQSQLPPDQKYTMQNLYEILKNNTKIPWNPSKDPCSWKGINCSFSLNQSSITQISLSSFSISNSDSLIVMCNISTLESIDLSENRLSSIPEGFITSCGELTGLRVLNFSMNRLVGNLPTFSGFENLEILDLSWGSLSGNISSQLSGLDSLRIVNLAFNLFTGSLPTQLGKHFVLEELFLSVNQFRGKLPEEIANYSNLVTIDLSENLLFGSVPGRVGELSKLESLILSSNYLSGEIPGSLSNIRTLKRFAANTNRFSGTLPSGITNFLKNLDLSFNKLSGEMPLKLLSQPNLQTVDLSGNLLSGSIPEKLSASLVRLRLGSNLLSGEIKSSSFENVRNLTYLELEFNNLTGLIPHGLGLCKDLALLNLANNELTGILSLELGNLSNLQELKLQSNKLIGEIPIIIGKMHGLRKLNLSGNSLNGSIPSSVANLQNLTYLDLSRNNLSGSIPDSIGNLNSLIELQLGENHLTGKIPLMPYLQIALNLSGNLFAGPIPETVWKLGQLEVLDLSNNRFSGRIPQFLAGMNTLTTLELSNNLLSGLVPKFPSYISVKTRGNKDLIYERTGPQRPSHRKRKTLVKKIMVPIVISVVVAILIVTIAAIFVSKFYLKPNQQQIESHEDFSQTEIIRGALLTRNPLHRSNINFGKAMELVIDPSKVVMKTKFSTYYKATMPSGSHYFVKKLDWAGRVLFQSGSHDRFGEEFQVLSKLNNSNIMTPLAYVLTLDNAFIFYEYFRMGTLFDALHNRNMGNALDWMSRYSIAIGVAQGLAYLHEYGSDPILLLDLSSMSILLRSHKEPQIGDIELWKVIDLTENTASLSAVAGSVGYIPPEYAYTMRVTMAGNVYSLGVILLELLTGRPAVNQGVVLAKWAPLIIPAKHKDFNHIFDKDITRTSLAVKNQMLAVLKVALACVSDSPDARPDTKTIVRMLLNAR